MNRFPFAAAAALVVTASTATSAYAQSVPNPPTGPIETKYYADGPFAVTLTTTSDACDHKGNICDIWSPTETGNAPVRQPMVLWANGTSDKAVTPDIYGYWLKHLASWGFIVVATRDGATGYGDTVLDTLNYMKRQNDTPQGPFFHRIDTANVGSAGHSQGATGAANAQFKSNGAIKTTVSIELPAQMFCSPADNCLTTPTLTGARTGSIFYVSGTNDPLSTNTQLGGSQLNSLTAYYNATPASLTKAKGFLHGPSHNDIQGDPTCGAKSIGFCVLGVYGFLGFPTAWMAWQLQGATDGQAAFKQGSGEFFTAKAWGFQQSNAQ